MKLLPILLPCWAAFSGAMAAEMKDYPVQPVPFTAVRVEASFWSPRMETNRVTTVWYDFQKCEETGRIDNFAKAGKLMPGQFRGTPFDDSDVFKVIEGAAYTLALHPDTRLDKYLDELIAKIAAAQEPDGYLYTARTIDPKCRVDFFGPSRWSQLEGSHELYNVGHLYEAAVDHFQATGKGGGEKAGCREACSRQDRPGVTAGSNENPGTGSEEGACGACRVLQGPLYGAGGRLSGEGHGRGGSAEHEAPPLLGVPRGDEHPRKGTWYRVRIGSFANKEAAEKLANELKAKEGTASFVTAE